MTDAQATNAEPDPPLRVSTVARRLGVHQETVRSWIRQRKIESVRMPTGQLAVASSVLDRILTPEQPIGQALLSKCGVYFIQVGEFTKIGYAEDVEGRYAAIDRLSPYPTKLALVLRHPSTAAARAHEIQLHSRFAASRHKHEWFRTTIDIAEFVAGAGLAKP
jgi:excisionase family DNA binding protein